MATRVIGTRFACSLRSAPARSIQRPLHVAAPASARPRRGPAAIRAAVAEAPPRDEVITTDPDNNVTDNIYGKIGMNLHLQQSHPLSIIREHIYQYFDAEHNDAFKKFDDLYPVVSTHANFDSVLVPADHVSRQPNDTYYVNKQTVLRCAAALEQRYSGSGPCLICITGYAVAASLANIAVVH